MNISVASRVPATPASRTVKVMIVDDAVVVRGLVARWLGEIPGIEVVARHRNGRLAVEDVAKSAPDVIVLDIEMPEMDGMTALPLLLERCPGVKIIMCSTLTQRNAEISIRALAEGAADYVPKPESNSGVTTSKEFRRDIVNKVLALGGVDPAASARAPRKTGSSAPAGVVAPLARPGATSAIALRPFSKVKPKILVIGSSTGGPQALLRIMPAMSGMIAQVPTIITQHMPPTFTGILAGHLAKATGRPCAEAVDGETLVSGSIYVAPGGHHLLIGQRGGTACARLDDSPPINFCKPAVDPMFESAVAVYGGSILAVILTGMGHDGCGGARRIADAGGSVIAQDEATSVVWGMPGSAAAAGVCSAVLPLGEIAARVGRVLAGGAT